MLTTASRNHEFCPQLRRAHDPLWNVTEGGGLAGGDLLIQRLRPPAASVHTLPEAAFPPRSSVPPEGVEAGRGGKGTSLGAGGCSEVSGLLAGRAWFWGPQGSAVQ